VRVTHLTDLTSHTFYQWPHFKEQPSLYHIPSLLVIVLVRQNAFSLKNLSGTENSIRQGFHGIRACQKLKKAVHSLCSGRGGMPYR
jgi:hypothetical protein